MISFLCSLFFFLAIVTVVLVRLIFVKGVSVYKGFLFLLVRVDLLILPILLLSPVAMPIEAFSLILVSSFFKLILISSLILILLMLLSLLVFLL